MNPKPSSADHNSVFNLVDIALHIIITISFSLVNPDILSELIGLIITEPSKDLEESARFRLPNIAAEILSCEVPQINEQVYK